MKNDKGKISRRNFVISSSGLLAASAFASPLTSKFSAFRWLASATESRELSDHLLMHLQIEGGADMLQSLDPMSMPANATEKEFYRDYGDSDIFVKGNVSLGPAAHALKPFIDQMAIVRGIWMSTGFEGSHESCRTYMASGEDRGWQRSNIIPSEFSRFTGAGPFGAICNTSREFAMYIDAAGCTTSSQIQGMDINSLSTQGVLQSMLSPFGWTKPFQSREQYARSGKEVSEFLKHLNAIKQDLGVSQLSDERVIIEALGFGISAQAFFNCGGDFNGPGPGLDDHGGYVGSHLKDQTWHWQKVAEIFKLCQNVEFKKTGKSVFDQTTFIVTNEFSRPPHLGYSGGKDHNPETNSTLLAGRGVRGGTVIGGSGFIKGAEATYPKHRLVGMPIDWKTGRALTEKEVGQIENAEHFPLIKPEHVIATLADIFGVNPAHYRPISKMPIRLLPALKA